MNAKTLLGLLVILTAAAVSNAADTKVTLSDVHLCCNKCVTTVKETLAKVDGVKGNTVAPRAKNFTVTGDFNDKQVFDDLNKAGLAGKAGAAADAK